MATFEVVLFPSGNAEGFPALRITPESCRKRVVSLADATSLASLGSAAETVRYVEIPVEEIATAIEPFWIGNCWGVWLDGFTWDPRTAEIVDTLANDERWSRRHMVATMDVARPETAIQRCTLVADASRALASARDDAEALAIIERLHPFEGVADLVVSLRYAAGPDVLNRLHAAVGPTGGGTVYSPPNAPWTASLRRSVIQARSPWAMRLREESPEWP
jgi:hypothetical protein